MVAIFDISRVNERNEEILREVRANRIGKRLRQDDVSTSRAKGKSGETTRRATTMLIDGQARTKEVRDIDEANDVSSEQ